ncbi:N-6 DNA methylase [Halosimplex rubrum]|uniref:site-specific DNA-methyltransferase (adenine-specific) n=1 Tax=Halosimplex rubrum TaxID=869889 RepID=A0A7D5TRI5_9EURY|nr:N-6 DNA methylase [Halosimplex rubrum]QLH79814.1 N-6 DNA methylase [Halosimplex rubrum]
MPYSKSVLKEYFYESIEILRGNLSVTEYREFLIPLLYYKMASDESNLRDKLDATATENHPDLRSLPHLPKENRWQGTVNIPSHLDEGLNQAISNVPNDPLAPTTAFKPDYTKLGHDGALQELTDHLSRCQLDSNSAAPAELGAAFEYLLDQLARIEGKQGSQNSTPRGVRQLCTRIAGPFVEGESVHDPTVGVAGLLVKAGQNFETQTNRKGLELTGQEIHPQTASLAGLNLEAHGLNGEIHIGDSLRNPQFTENGRLQQFDCVFADFPVSPSWAKEEFEQDRFHRFSQSTELPLPRADQGDYAFIFHALNQLRDPAENTEGGRGVILISHGVLYRQSDRVYREYLVDNDLVEAVIGLPPNLYANTSLPVAILVINKDKKSGRQNEVRFVHAMDEEFYTEFESRNNLSEDGIERVIDELDEWNDDSEIAKTVSIEEIRENGHTLDLSEYIPAVEPTAIPGLNRELRKVDSTSYEGKVNLPAEPEFSDILGKVMEVSENSVYVLGSYTGAREAELIDIKQELEEMGYDAHLDKDLPDFPSQDLSGSVATTMRLAGFCIMVDREASGHIDEYRLAEKQRTVLARLTPKDGGSTKMIGGAELVDVNYIKSFEFDLRPQERLEDAVSWAQQMVEKRRAEYSKHYDWRG